MARKTFGRDGRVIVVTSEPTDGDGIEGDIPVTIDSDGRIEPSLDTDNGDTGNGVEDFQPVGDTIRTQPIDGGTGYGATPGFNDPATAGRKLNKDGTPRKPRGSNRPKDAQSTEGKRPVISAQLDAMLFGLHTMAASMLREPELCISEDESKVLAQAIEKMANAYNLSAMLSPKTSATIDLCIALGTVYGPRVMVLSRKGRRTERNVTPIDKAQ